MYKYVLKRLLLLIPVLLGVILLVFSIMAITPGKPAINILGVYATQAEIDAFNELHGLNEPFVVRLLDYIKDIVLRFDFGTSYRGNKPVIDQILSRFSLTFRFVLISIIISSIIGIILGVIAAVRQYSVMDTVGTVIAMLLSAIPAFWLGLMLVLLFALKLRILPSNGIDDWRCYVLPLVTLVVTGAASTFRMTRSSMLETVRQDYIRTAKAKGVSPRVVIFKHALKNALLPVITQLGMTFGSQLGGTVVVESVFGIPGLGSLVLDAIGDRDMPLVMGSVLFLATLFCIIMLVVDLVFAYIDPRIKARYMSQR